MSFFADQGNQASRFLDFATLDSPRSQREEILNEFQGQLHSVSDGAEFDLLLWSLARRLGTDTEELLREIGGRWLLESGILSGLEDEFSKQPFSRLESLLLRLMDQDAPPLLGWESLKIEKISSSKSGLTIACVGARRCSSFIEGVARCAFSEAGLSLRYRRQPKKASYVTISFAQIGG